MLRFLVCTMLASVAVHALTQDEMEMLARLNAKAAAERNELALRQRRQSADASIRVCSNVWPCTHT